jgi:type I restriction enzyme, S subunit
MNAPLPRSATNLGNLVDILSGFAFKSEAFAGTGKLPVVRIRDVKRGYSETFYSGDYDDRYVVDNGDILVGMDGEFNRERWKGGKALLNQRVCKLVPDEERLSADYLYYLLPRALKDIEDRTPFATVKHLSSKDIKDVRITLPTLKEQRRIAAILDKADMLHRERKRAVDLIGSLTQSIFKEFYDPTSKRTRRPTKPLGALCDLVRGSSPRPQGDARFFGGPVPRLMIADITRDGKYVLPTIDSLTEEGAKKSRPMSKGSVVMAVSGAVGLPSILAVDACIHDGFVGFRKLDPSILPAFLYHFLLENRSENQAQGTGAICSKSLLVS